MSGYLTTHILDTAIGRPAAGIPIKLFAIAEEARLIGHTMTNSDGRTDQPILAADKFHTGLFELRFEVGDYLRAHAPDGGFFDQIPIRFRMSEPCHYHVPLLLSPYGYSTYRGS